MHCYYEENKHLNILTLFEGVAGKMKPYQKFSYLLVVSILLILAIPFIFPNQAEFLHFDISGANGRLGLLATIWLLFLNIIVSLFIDIPKKGDVESTLFLRCKLKMKRFFYFLLAIFFVLLTLVILVLSIRLIRV